MININSLVSIIIPIYNVEKYLSKCIESVICQTYHNIEIILVDDGSTDKSSIICDNYKKKDNRIIVIHKKNEGLSSARNVGLDFHKGEYIVFIDSDDYVCNTYIEKLYNNIIESNADISMCDFYHLVDNKIISNSYSKKYFIITDDSKYDYLENEYRYITNYQWTKIYKSKIFDKIRYPVGKNFEDIYLIVYELYNSKRISYMLEPLYYHNKRLDSITGNYRMDRLDAIDALDDRINFFKEFKMNEFIKSTKINKLNKIIKYVYKINKINLDNDDINKINCYKNKGKILAKELLLEKITLKNRIKYFLFLYFEPLLKVFIK